MVVQSDNEKVKKQVCVAGARFNFRKRVSIHRTEKVKRVKSKEFPLLGN